MKVKLIILLSLLFSTLRAQNNEIGVGIGTSNFFKLNYELYYSFQYKLAYTRIQFMYTPANTEYFKSLTHYSVLLGIQSSAQKKSKFHIAMGARYLIPENHYDNGILDKRHTNQQTNFFLLSGYSYNLNQNHLFFLDLFMGGIKVYKEYRNYYEYEPIADVRLSIGYAFCFGNKKLYNKSLE